MCYGSPFSYSSRKAHQNTAYPRTYQDRLIPESTRDLCMLGGLRANLHALREHGSVTAHMVIGPVCNKVSHRDLTQSSLQSIRKALRHLSLRRHDAWEYCPCHSGGMVPRNVAPRNRAPLPPALTNQAREVQVRGQGDRVTRFQEGHGFLCSLSRQHGH